MDDQPTVTVFVDLRFAEVYRATAALMYKQLRVALYITGAIGLLFLNLLAFAKLRPEQAAEWRVILENGKPMFWAVSIPYLIVFVIPLLTTQRFLNHPTVKAGYKYELSDVGVRLQTNVSDVHLQWSAYKEAVETDTVFRLFMGASQILPKRCFADSLDIEAVRALVRAHIKKHKLAS